MKNRKKSEQNGVFAAIRMAAGAHPVLTAGTLLCVAGSVGASLVPPLLLPPHPLLLLPQALLRSRLRCPATSWT